MPKVATVTIAGREKPVMVREMILLEINALMTAPERPIVEAIAHLLELSADISLAEVLKIAPSDLQPLIDKLLELNQAFFDQAATLEMTGIAAEFRRTILRISMLAYLHLSPPGTASESGATPTECSSTPSSN